MSASVLFFKCLSTCGTYYKKAMLVNVLHGIKQCDYVLCMYKYHCSLYSKKVQETSL